MNFTLRNLFGTKADSIFFDDMVKIYTSKGIRTISFFNQWGLNQRANYDSYEVDIIKIQMKNGEIFRLDMDQVWSSNDLLDALRKKPGEHMFHHEES
jgi:hypothetical protein